MPKARQTIELTKTVSFVRNRPPPRSLHRRSWRRLRRGAAEPNSGAMAHGASGFAAAALGHHHRRPQPALQVDNDAHVDNAAAAGRWPSGVPAPPGAMVLGLWWWRRPLCHRRRRRREQRRGQCACHLPPRSRGPPPQLEAPAAARRGGAHFWRHGTWRRRFCGGRSWPPPPPPSTGPPMSATRSTLLAGRQRERCPDGVPAPPGAVVPGLWRRRRSLCHRRRRRREQRRGQCACHLRSLALALVP